MKLLCRGSSEVASLLSFDLLPEAPLLVVPSNPLQLLPRTVDVLPECNLLKPSTIVSLYGHCTLQPCSQHRCKSLLSTQRMRVLLMDRTIVKQVCSEATQPRR